MSNWQQAESVADVGGKPGTKNVIPDENEVPRFGVKAKDPETLEKVSAQSMTRQGPCKLEST